MGQARSSLTLRCKIRILGTLIRCVAVAHKKCMAMPRQYLLHPVERLTSVVLQRGHRVRKRSAPSRAETVHTVERICSWQATATAYTRLFDAAHPTVRAEPVRVAANKGSCSCDACFKQQQQQQQQRRHFDTAHPLLWVLGVSLRPTVLVVAWLFMLLLF